MKTSQSHRRASKQARRRLPVLIGAALVVGPTALIFAPAVASAASQKSSGTAISVEKSSSWGPVLVEAGGWTVYRLTSDGNNKSNCFGSCAKVWPPVLLAAGQKSPIGDGVHHLGAIKRSAGKWQVTFEGMPLYRFVGDAKPGQITGNVKDTFGRWWAIDPAHPKSPPVEATKGGSSSGSTTTTVPGGGVAY